MQIAAAKCQMREFTSFCCCSYYCYSCCCCWFRLLFVWNLMTSTIRGGGVASFVRSLRWKYLFATIKMSKNGCICPKCAAWRQRRWTAATWPKQELGHYVKREGIKVTTTIIKYLVSSVSLVHLHFDAGWIVCVETPHATSACSARSTTPCRCCCCRFALFQCATATSASATWRRQFAGRARAAANGCWTCRSRLNCRKKNIPQYLLLLCI